MIWIGTYFAGVLAASAIMIKQNRAWKEKYPEDPEKYQWGYGVIAACMSWIAVAALVFGGLAGFNRLDEE